MSQRERRPGSRTSGRVVVGVRAEPQESRSRSRWVFALVLVVALGAAGGFGITLAPERFGLSAEHSPVSDDVDGDGLKDEVEKSGWLTRSGDEYITDPFNADTDGDGLSDSEEAGSVVADAPSGEPMHLGYSNPLVADTDDDGLSDAVEADLTLDPWDRDSDDDEIDDGQEVQVVGTDAASADTDDDGFDDGYEDTNADSKGLDPLVFNEKVSKTSYATDFAIGSVMGDAWRKDSFAWLAGNLASSGSSSIPGIGWIVGPLADARDAIASAIRGDWVGSGFSAVGAVPYAGDAVSIPGKAAEFVARNPDLAAGVAKTVVAINKVPDQVKVEASEEIWKNWDELKNAGASDGVLLQLQRGETNLDALADALKGSTRVEGPSGTFFANGPEGEKFLEGLYRVDAAVPGRQVSASTRGCIDVCNALRRRFDVLADGVAHESKVGQVRLSDSIKRQIRSDAWLTETGQIAGAHWHFFASAYNNKLGASRSVLDLLDEFSIPYTIHLPA